MFVPANSSHPFGAQWMHFPSTVLFQGKNEAWDNDIAGQASDLLHASLVWIHTMQAAPSASNQQQPSTMQVPSVVDHGKHERARLLADLMKVFVLPAQYYTHDAIGSLLGSIVRRLTDDTTQELPLVEAVGERFESLLADVVDEYSACSFADALFTRLLLVCLRMNQPPSLRVLLWHRLDYNINALQPPHYRTDTLHADTSAIEDAYLYPIESNFALLRVYASALTEGKVRPERNHFLYSLVVHHITSFIFDATELSAWLRQQLLLSLNQVCIMFAAASEG
jgi:hypothetical protein